MKDVQCKNGERFAVATEVGARGETDVGVAFDGGLIPWDQVAGFWSQHEPTSQIMFISVD